MKKKIIITILIIIIAVILIACCVSTEVENNVENITEIQPEPEISEEETRQTTINLYFEDKISGIIAKEQRKVDSKELIDAPYEYVLKLLIEGPKIDDLNNPIPEGTKINSVNLEKGVLYVDLSPEFLNASGTNAIYSIVNTMTEFTEINGVKFTINGETKDGLKEIFSKS